MVALRFFLILFNVAVVTFLVYKIVMVINQPVERCRKIMVVLGGILLLLAPIGIFIGIFAPTFQYFLIYPIAISLFLYLTRQL